MLIALAQIRPAIQNIEANLENHIFWIREAHTQNADLIVFPELSLSNYDPNFCVKNAFSLESKSLKKLQSISDTLGISIAVGVPMKSKNGVNISMVLFSKNEKAFVYSKQHLHKDELEHFLPRRNTNKFPFPSIAPAICYESTIPAHYQKAAESDADLYLVSVAKSKTGIKRNRKHLQHVASNHSMFVMHVNYVGDCGEFIAGGESSIINKKGKVLAKLDSKEEGLLIYNWDNNLG